MLLDFNHIRLNLNVSEYGHLTSSDRIYSSRNIRWQLNNMSTSQMLTGSIEVREGDSWIDILIEDIRGKITEHNFNLNERNSIIERIRQELENEPAPEPLRQEYYDEAYLDAAQRQQQSLEEEYLRGHQF